VLCGHKHVPWVWELGDMVILNAGTASSKRIKGRIKQSYNIIEIDEKIRIHRVSPNGIAEKTFEKKLQSNRGVQIET